MKILAACRRKIVRGPCSAALSMPLSGLQHIKQKLLPMLVCTLFRHQGISHQSTSAINAQLQLYMLGRPGITMLENA